MAEPIAELQNVGEFDFYKEFRIAITLQFYALHKLNGAKILAFGSLKRQSSENGPTR